MKAKTGLCYKKAVATALKARRADLVAVGRLPTGFLSSIRAAYFSPGSGPGGNFGRNIGGKNIRPVKIAERSPWLGTHLSAHNFFAIIPSPEKKFWQKNEGNNRVWKILNHGFRFRGRRYRCGPTLQAMTTIIITVIPNPTPMQTSNG